MYFLRFTTDPERDIRYGKSLWRVYDSAEAERLIEQDKACYYNSALGEYVLEHCGLSGHALEAETLEEALEEVQEGGWFGRIDRDSWAIFEGEEAVRDWRYATTEESKSCDFIAHAVVHFVASDNVLDLSL